MFSPFSKLLLISVIHKIKCKHLSALYGMLQQLGANGSLKVKSLRFLLYYLYIGILHYRQEKLTMMLSHVPALP